MERKKSLNLPHRDGVLLLSELDRPEDLGDEQQHHGGQRQRGDLQVRPGPTAVHVGRKTVGKGPSFLQGDQDFSFGSFEDGDARQVN